MGILKQLLNMSFSYIYRDKQKNMENFIILFKYQIL